ncbi:hypothetical protein DID80_03210 [Candidatus Marinamargulisbacteria bacterium SCGC AAA071-K20]|nr:hypothetical protein DID80_03210 [Candidatus Marinamargulisbacteria bacterium SCGC AAA071-K20]
MKLKQSVLSILVILLFSLGCARTVTDKDVTLNFQIELTFQGPIDTSKYNYLVIFSKVASPNISLPEKFIESSTDQYFPTPGRTYLEDPLILLSQTLNQLYDNYFNTWSDYILINDNETLFFHSNSTGFATTSDNFTYVEENGFEVSNAYSNGDNKILFSFDKDFLTSSVGVARYISFATTEIKDATQTGYFRDKIDQQLQITIQKDEEVEDLDDNNDSDIPDAAEIKAWRVKIF